MAYKNPEDAKAYLKTYRKANKEKRKAYDKARYEANKEKIMARKKAYYEANKERLAEKAKAVYEKNKEKLLAQKKEYRQTNKAKINALNALRKAAKKHRTPSWLTKEDLGKIESIYKEAQKRKEETGEVWHVDHIIPLQGENISGLHVPDNLQLLRAKENISKKNRYTI